MADFEHAQKFLEKWEGGYVNDGDDRGGETIFGISRKAHPDWPGWAQIDSGMYDRHELLALARKLYKRHYWMPLLADQYPSQRLATIVYQAAVNCSVRRASRWLQSSCNDVTGSTLTIDGRIGNHTLHALQLAANSSNLKAVESRFLAQQKTHYEYLIGADPSQEKFRKGWMNRLEGAAAL